MAKSRAAWNHPSALSPEGESPFVGPLMETTSPISQLKSEHLLRDRILLLEQAPLLSVLDSSDLQVLAGSST
jgi:hypothetical protein